MPVGKSGQYFSNPHEMRRRGDAPGTAEPKEGSSRPHDQEQGGQGGEGDGNHHHEIHEDKETGTYHSVHTHPDGSQEHADHASYEEASDHQDRMMGHGEEPESDHAEPDGDEDMAGMYESHAKQ